MRGAMIPLSYLIIKHKTLTKSSSHEHMGQNRSPPSSTKSAILHTNGFPLRYRYSHPREKCHRLNRNSNYGKSQQPSPRARLVLSHAWSQLAILRFSHASPPFSFWLHATEAPRSTGGPLARLLAGAARVVAVYLSHPPAPFLFATCCHCRLCTRLLLSPACCQPPLIVVPRPEKEPLGPRPR